MRSSPSISVAHVRESFSQRRPHQASRRYGFAPEVIKPAAALVPVVDDGGEAAILVTKRPSTMKFHKDDWVFPGGRLDESRDRDRLDAALREVEEEIGVARSDIEPLGQLATYGPFTTGFLLDVFVGVIRSPGAISPDFEEVAEVGIFPLSHFMGDGVYSTGSVPEAHDPGPSEGRSKTGAGVSDLRFFHLRGDEYLWGTQGEIVWDLLCHVCGTIP
jgi:8-oxo-dGTP pyrophosphatase MutT (NUDIX family)